MAEYFVFVPEISGARLTCLVMIRMTNHLWQLVFTSHIAHLVLLCEYISNFQSFQTSAAFSRSLLDQSLANLSKTSDGLKLRGAQARMAKPRTTERSNSKARIFPENCICAELLSEFHAT